ncbi:MAG: class I SAM-dependent rRNA methyltransferase [Bacteroidota bacterium]
MKDICQIRIKKGREGAILRKHHWVFSGAVQTIMGNPDDGDLVRVEDFKGQFLAIGHYQQGSILVRIITFRETEINPKFWEQKITEALILRQNLGLVDNASTNAFRLINGEGDGLPGLIIDVYNDCAVIQTHSYGMAKSSQDIALGLKSVLGNRVETIYDKSKVLLGQNHEHQKEFLLGDKNNTTILENGNLFFVDWETGQKTGFFLDQRENRQLLSRFSEGKTILNAFCYSGGFSVYALMAGASHVDSVDASQKAINWTNQNVVLNPSSGTHDGVCMDVLKFLQSSTKDYDVMVLDPPAYAKRRSARHKAVQGYKRLNLEGIKKVKPGGILFTFSCSQVVDRKLFRDTILASALEAGRPCRVIHELSQPADHPINMFHPEGAYLKGLVLYLS